MVMDPEVRALYSIMNGMKFTDESAPIGLGLNPFLDQGFLGNPNIPPDPNPRNFVPLSNSTLSSDSSCDYIASPSIACPGGQSFEDCDFSDVVLKYISQMLMEEDIEDKTCMFQESTALQAAEKSLYDVLGEVYPPSGQFEQQLTPFLDQNLVSPDENYVGNYSNYNDNSFVDPQWRLEYHDSPIQNVPFDLASRSTSLSSVNSTSPSSSGSREEGFVDSPISNLRVPEISCGGESVEQFNKGVEAANKFLPISASLFIDLENQKTEHEPRVMVVKVEKKNETKHSPDGSRGKKNPHSKDSDLEQGRSNKQSALYTEPTVSSKMFDYVLLCGKGKNESVLREALQIDLNKDLEKSGQTKGSSGGKSRGKKQSGKKDLVDLRTLLTLCAQAVVADDRRTANELLSKVRLHSSPTGDGSQRLAHYFANGLEARLAGSGTQIYKGHIAMPTSASDILKAYHLFLAACPFKKVSNFFSNKTIMKIAETESKIHIIDFGILYGFQWPCLIERLSRRPNGPPKLLRITGVDFPCPGFKPAERVQETGRRLENYAKSFNVPFEFNAIAQNWETIQIEDLKIKSDEALVVNCLFRMRNILDETVVVESPRNIVLNLIQKVKPRVFIQGIVNGAFSAPFFITRFREALFHFSALFDILETTVPREREERRLIEKEIFGREAMNVVACEGAERVERPETYKQWQVRNLRAGFKQLPLNREIVSMAKDWVNNSYHKDFVIDEDGPWLLQGWKGRIVYVLTTWKPEY